MLETLYADFTTKLLPKIQEGLVITKDYFTDLFGRYVHFLIVVDTLSAILWAVGAALLGFGVIKIIKYNNKEDNWDDNIGAIFGVVFGTLFTIIMIALSINSVILVIKDKYIPEVRVLEKLNIIKSDE